MSDETNPAREHAEYASNLYAEVDNAGASAAALVSIAHSLGVLVDYLAFPAYTVGNGMNDGHLCPMCHTIHPLRVRAQETSEVSA